MTDIKRIKELEKILEKECEKYENDCATCPYSKECDEYEHITTEIKKGKV